MIYVLFTWPFSQAVMDYPGAILVNPESADGEDYDTDLDSSYMVPESELPTDEKTLSKDRLLLEAIEHSGGEYIMVEFPDSQAHEDDDDIIHDYDGNVFVPAYDEKEEVAA